MKDLERRVKKIEERAGLSDRKSYLFIHICRPEGYYSNEELKRTGIYENEDFRGTVVIIEKCGKENRWIDVSSGEGRRILIENGYKKLN
ncbi:MAG: hypothetical protein Q8N14_06185 [Candidatus Omnitrophota bacterium]|nr:hypothetical protein [Candidatus Omnitrophota bacterium]